MNAEQVGDLDFPREVVITHDGVRPDHGASRHVHGFRLESGHDSHLATGCASLPLASAWQRRQGIELSLERAVLHATVAELEARVRSGSLPPSERTEKVTQIVFAVEDYAYLEALLNEKHCQWQEPTPRAYRCRATARPDDDRTTPRHCTLCPLPDSRVLCDHLQHPRATSYQAGGGVPLQRDIASAMCAIGEQIGAGHECLPNGRPCWERRIGVGPNPAELIAQPARALVDEIDFLNLIWRSRGWSAFLSAAELRSVSDLHLDCLSGEEFQTRACTLALLLDGIDVTDAAGPLAHHDDDPTRPKRPRLVVLEKLAERDAAQCVDDVKRLRQVHKTRNSFPVHAGSSGATALAALGIRVPTDDWSDAWLRLLSNAAISLRNIRVAFNSAPPAANE